MQSKQLVPKLRFPEFLVGSDWTYLHGDKLFDPVDRRPAQKGLPILAITQEHGAVSRDEIDYHVSVTDASIASYKEVRPGDFIISLRSFQGGIEYSRVHGICSPAYVILGRKGDGVDDFYRQLFKSPRFIQQITRNIEGLRDGKMISYKQFSEQLLPAPSPPEQRKIAECLTSVDELIAAEGRKLEALRGHKRALMQNLFPSQGETTPRLRFPEFGDGPEWSAVPLGDLLTGKPEYGVNAAAVPFSEDLPAYLRITDINDAGRYISSGKVSVDIDATEANYLSDGDIALARTGASVGKSYLYREKDGRLVFAGFLIRIRPDKKKVVPTLLANFMTTQLYWDWVRVTSARSGQPGINGTEYATLSVPIPPKSDGNDELAEQRRIAACLGSLDALISEQSTKLDALKLQKQGLLQGFFPTQEEGE